MRIELGAKYLTKSGLNAEATECDAENGFHYKIEYSDGSKLWVDYNGDFYDKNNPIIENRLKDYKIVSKQKK